ncbi:neutral zinc metallopeptidase [Actinoalloteichus caeruleus]|uniref:neutral zinc metallopeptidase n=1 Tax=Actinoalloteichus cyanogriseus TaxID=2893586 RepID=UPI003BB9A183
MASSSRTPSPARIVAALVVGLVVLVACGHREVVGTASALERISPDEAAGLPITSGPSGPRASTPPIRATALNSDGGPLDQLALAAVTDLYDYWEVEFPATFPGLTFEPVATLLSYDANGQGVLVCGMDTTGVPNAFYCPSDDSIAWDRGVLLPELRNTFSEMAVVTVIAHEMGHAVQYKAGQMGPAMPTILAEQQADCYAGAYFRYVADGESPFFEISTGEGLNAILATLFFIRDQAGTDYLAPRAHGSAFDRVSAFTFGFTDGPSRCAEMDIEELEGRITQLEFAEGDANSGELPIVEENVEHVAGSLREVFARFGDGPALDYQGVSCGNTAPVAFCEAEDVISLDLAALQVIGTAPRRQGDSGIGDFAAFAEIASRYALWVQAWQGLPLRGDEAGLRTACLVGAWAGELLPDGAPRPGRVRISPGDLDEAIAELLTEGSLIAADIDGESIPAGFARVESLRIGFEDGMDTCLDEFSG